MDLKLSFILPVYNVEAYLPACIDSILSQMTGQCEIILVDDGAKDASGSICDQYAAGDERIRVIHKENGGLSSARNAGMDLARGQYLCFVDSDDYIADGTVSKVLSWISSHYADVCFLKLHKVYEDGRKEELCEALVGEKLRLSRESALLHLASRTVYPGSACAKLWNRDFMEKNGFRFPDDRRLSEDLIFCLNAYLKAESFDLLEFPFYCYRQERTGSITSQITPKYFFDSLLFTEEVCSRFSQDRKSPEGIFSLSAGAYEYMIRLWEAGELKEKQQEAWEKLRSCSWGLSCGQGRKARITVLAVRLLGLKNTSRLLGIYQSRRSQRGN